MNKLNLILALVFLQGCSTLNKKSEIMSFKDCMDSPRAEYDVSDVVGSKEYLGLKLWAEELEGYCEFMSEGGPGDF
jgi:hypothetical protein